MSSRQEPLLRALALGGPMTSTRLSTMTGVDLHATRNSLYTLRRQGYVRDVGKDGKEHVWEVVA